MLSFLCSTSFYCTVMIFSGVFSYLFSVSPVHVLTKACIEPSGPASLCAACGKDTRAAGWEPWLLGRGCSWQLKEALSAFCTQRNQRLKPGCIQGLGLHAVS